VVDQGAGRAQKNDNEGESGAHAHPFRRARRPAPHLVGEDVDQEQGKYRYDEGLSSSCSQWAAEKQPSTAMIRTLLVRVERAPAPESPSVVRTELSAMRNFAHQLIPYALILGAASSARQPH